ncbi:MAG TPA: hypothetical protein VK914_10235 [bacterium]|jgi:hypothetical protein|nr:hypothetical protein [bacterium]
MTNAQVEKMRKTLKEEIRDFKPGKKELKEALKHLLAAGIVRPLGNLRKIYKPH